MVHVYNSSDKAPAGLALFRSLLELRSKGAGLLPNPSVLPRTQGQPNVFTLPHSHLVSQQSPLQPAMVMLHVYLLNAGANSPLEL